MNVLETERLNLRKLTLDDAPFVLGLLNEASFLQFIGDRGVRTVEGAREYLAKGALASYERHGFGLYMTELKGLGTPMGVCGLVKRDALPDVDIGFAFLPAYWGKGYAFESAAAVLAYGRDVIRLTRIVAIVSSDNQRSIGVLGKLGLRFEKTIPWQDDGGEVDLYAARL